MRTTYALTVAAAALLAFTPHESMADTIINYELSPDASLIICASCNWVQNLSGGFAYDVTTGSVTSSTIYGTGWFGAFTNTVLINSTFDSINLEYRGTQNVTIDFVDPLGSASDPISRNSSEAGYSMQSATGSADQVPEPATLTIIGTGMAALAWTRRRRSNRTA